MDGKSHVPGEMQKYSTPTSTSTNHAMFQWTIIAEPLVFLINFTRPQSGHGMAIEHTGVP